MNAFNFDIERQELIENLNYLKSLKVEEYTLYKKWYELRHYIEPERQYIHDAKHFMWHPPETRSLNKSAGSDTDATIEALNQLKPRLIMVGDRKHDEINFRRWEAYRYFLSSAEHNGVPGRFIRILIIDENAKGGKFLGIASIASDFNSIGCRDDFIGWSAEQRANGGLNHTAVGSTIVPTQPFGFNFLGGKLIAALITALLVRDEWRLRYGDVLAGLTTTSLFGSPCMYDSHPWWKKLGKAKGSLLIHPDEEIYLRWREWVKANRRKEFAELTERKLGCCGPATSEKNQVLGLIFDAVGISAKAYAHGYERGVYFSSFYQNTKEFLCGRIPESGLRLKPRFQADVEAIAEWWRPRAINRYLQLKAENRLKLFSPFYNDMESMDFQTAKEKYFGDVGR